MTRNFLQQMIAYSLHIQVGEHPKQLNNFTVEMQKV